MYDKLFGTICLERGLVTKAQLAEAIHTGEQLRELGLERPLGELLVTKGYLSVQQANAIITEQQAADPSRADVVLGRLAMQNGLISEAQLNRALELQREAQYHADAAGSGGPGVEDAAAPTLGYLLVGEGYLTVQQLDAVVALQERLQARMREREPGLAGSAELLESGTFDAMPRIYFLQADAEPGGRRVGRAVEPDRERRIPVARLREMIRAGEVTGRHRVRRVDQEQPRQLRTLAEFASALADRHRIESDQAGRRRLWKHTTRATRLSVASVLLLGLVIGAFVLGQQTVDPSAAPADDQTTAADWLVQLGALGNETERPNDASFAGPRQPAALPSTGARTTMTDAQIASVMEAVGYAQVATLLGTTSWLPVAEADALQAWRTHTGGPTREDLQPFETPTAVRYGVPSADRVQLADGGIIVLGASEVERQRRVWLELVAREAAVRREGISVAEETDERLAIAQYLDSVQWPVHARRQRVAAFERAPQDPRVIAALGHVEFGEDVANPTRLDLLPIAPALPPPMPPLAPLLSAGDAPQLWDDPAMLDGLAVAYSRLGPRVPWASILVPLRPDEAIGEVPLLADEERERRRAGYARYLDHWLPREAFFREWDGARFPARRLVGSANAVEVWTDLPQLRSELFAIVDRLARSADTAFPRLARDAIGQALPAGGLRAGPARLVLVGGEEAMPLWVDGVVQAPSVVGDVAPTLIRLRSLGTTESTAAPILHGIARAYLRATLADRLPAWVREGVAAEMTLALLRELDLGFWADEQEALWLDQIALAMLAPQGPQTAGRAGLAELTQPADATATRSQPDAPTGLAWAAWHEIAQRGRAPDAIPRQPVRLASTEVLRSLYRAVAAGDADQSTRFSDELQRLIVGDHVLADRVRAFLDRRTLRQLIRDAGSATNPVPLLHIRPSALVVLDDQRLGLLDRTATRVSFFSAALGMGRRVADQPARPLPGRLDDAPTHIERRTLRAIGLVARANARGLRDRLGNAWRDLAAALEATGRLDWLRRLREREG